MRKDVRARNNAGRSFFFEDAFGNVWPEELVPGFDSRVFRDPDNIACRIYT